MRDDSSRLAALAQDHNAATDSLVAAFEAHVKEIVSKASARTLAIPQSRLELGKTSLHLIESNPANSKILARVDKLFAEQMTREPKTPAFQFKPRAYSGRRSAKHGKSRLVTMSRCGEHTRQG